VAFVIWKSPPPPAPAPALCAKTALAMLAELVIVK
jgi:hypothetical protein